MKRRSILPWVLGLFVVIPACGGYRAHMKNWEEYEPPSLFRTYAQPGPARRISTPSPDPEFEREVRKLKERQRQVEESIGKAEEDGSPRLDPARHNALLSAAKEDGLTEGALSKGFEMEDLEVLVRLRNPGIKGAERSLKASLEAYSQVWNLDEILRQYTAFTEGLMTGIGSMEGGESLEFKFPFPGVLALKGEIVTQEIAAAKEALAIARRTAIAQIRRAYWDLLFTNRALRINEEMLARLQHLEGVARVRYETGKTSFQDLVKIQIEAAKLGEDLKTLGEERLNSEAKIREILNLPPGTKMGTPVARPLPKENPALDGLYRVALERRQEIRQVRAMIGKMERMIEMAETMIFPSYSLNLSLFPDEAAVQVGTIAMKETFPVKVAASTGAGLPRMPWYGTNDAYLRETRQKLAALREELKKTEDETLFKVREAWFRLDRAKRQEALYDRKVVALSQAVLEISTRAYETGGAAFADVIESSLGWLNSRLSLERERSNLGLAYAELEEAVGAPWKE